MRLFPASWRRPRTILPRAERVRLLAEVLENRETPAGNVTAVYHAPSATLTLTGSNVGDVNQQVVIDGLGAGAVSVQGLFGTTINLGAGAVEYFNVKHLILNLNQGDDLAVLNNVEIEGNLTFRGGSGNDSLIVGNFPGADCSFGGLQYEGGDGNDSLLLHHGNHLVVGELRVVGGTGDTLVILGDQVGDSLSVGKLTYVGGAGFDTLQIGGASFSSAGPVSLNYGNGGSNTILAPTDSLTIDGPTSVNAGFGYDSFALGQGGTGNFGLGKLTINTAAGNSLVAFQGGSYLINGDLTFMNVSGDDDVLIEGTDFQLTGKLTYQSSGGLANIALLSTGTTTIENGVSIVNGPGDLGFNVGTGGVGDFVFQKFLKVSQSPGSCTTSFDGASHEINGDVTITAGATTFGHTLVAGGDSFNVSGKMVVSYGKAINTIVNLISATSVQVSGPVTILNQVGDDIAVFGNTETDVSLGGLTVANGSGQGVTVFNGNSVTIGGKVAVTNGTSTLTDVFSSNAVSFSVTGPVTINNGVGPTQLSIATLSGGTISGPVSILSGAGLDEIYLDGLDLNGVNINVGAGGSLIAFDINASNNGHLTINGGSGGNEVSLFGTTLGNVSITTGADDDVINMLGSVGGKLSVNTGGGADQINLTFAVVFGGTSIASGAGDDLVTIAGSAFNGSVLIQTGAGDDVVEIALADLGVESVFAQSVVIGAGPGTDAVTIGAASDPANRGLFQSSLVLDAGGGGADSLLIGPPRLNSFAVQPVIIGGWASVI